MNHKQVKLLLRAIGLLLLLGGITLCIIGFMNFGNFESDLFMLTILGCPCVAFGIGLTIFSFAQSISRYVKNEHVPILNEFAEDISPTIRSITQSAKEGFMGNIPHVCSKCGKQFDTDDAFCSNCGQKISITNKFCSKCGAGIEADDKFCSKCGAPLD
jgi:predicted nucleic acid-binding Zn ribbon protein